MDDKQKLLTEEDLQIKNLLVSEGIINNPRVERCGNWFNRKSEGSWGVKNLPHQYYCMRWECRFCRRKLIDIQRKHHYKYQMEFIKNGGQVLLFTLTVPHKIKDKLSSIYKRFKGSLVLLKESRGWEKIKNITNGKYHYDNIELTYGTEGYHLHDHINYGIMNPDISLSTIEDILFDHWSINTLKKKFMKISRKGINVSKTLDDKTGSMTDYKIPSITYGDKSIEQNDEIKGTHEYWERDYKKVLERNYNMKNRKEKLQEIGKNIKDVNTTFRKSKRGRIWTMNDRLS